MMIKSEDRLQHIKQWIARVVKKERSAHAYILEGRQGAGKRATALFFAQTLFCLSNDERGYPCGTCTECVRIQHRNHPDIHWIETDGASIKIEQIRHLQKEFAYRGVESQRKMYIIQHAERMTVQAANSLLKFIEEPHSGTVALLLTEQKHRLLPTIRSRCQEIKLPPPSSRQVGQALAAEYDAALAMIAAYVTADREEAATLCQTDWFADLRNLVIQLVEELHNPAVQALFHIQDKWLTVLKEREQVDVGLELLLLWYQDLLYTKIGLEDEHVYINQTNRLRQQAQWLSQERITQGLQYVLEAKKRLHANVNPQLLLEQLVIRLQEG
jgi:DNA polymerase-3 subunit delta'